ncbi:MAG: hypothetical protein PHW74_05060 [Desulfobacca sp.]|nr:hypothetical protein [Desulfobacca sp.]
MPPPTVFGLIVALQRELWPFLRRVHGKSRGSGLSAAWTFQLGPWPGVAVVSGMGAQRAENAAQTLIKLHSPRLLISLGYGGAVNPGLAAGTVVLGQEYWYYDPEGQILKPVDLDLPRQPVSELVTGLQTAGLPAAAGVLISTPRIISKHQEAEPLRSLENPVLDLETTAVAAVAQAYGIPFLGLRAITDTGDEEIPDLVIALTQTAGEPGWRAIWHLVITKPGYWFDLVRLGHRSRVASRHLALALTTLLPCLGPGLEALPPYGSAGADQ